VCAKEAGAPPRHQEAIIKAGYHDTVRTIIFTGRPLRVLRTDYIDKWENDRQQEIKELTAKVLCLFLLSHPSTLPNPSPTPTHHLATQAITCRGVGEGARSLKAIKLFLAKPSLKSGQKSGVFAISGAKKLRENFMGQISGLRRRCPALAKKNLPTLNNSQP
jgi:NAD(P)H-dependent flavin oxidoreductase YrpB (nitropropane dioxygenase family)